PGRLLAADHDHHSRVVERAVTGGPAGEPIEVETLVPVSERVERVAEPDPSLIGSNLLGGNPFGGGRRARGHPNRLVEESSARARQNRAARQAEDGQDSGSENERHGHSEPPSPFEVEASSRWGSDEKQQPDAAARGLNGQHD